MAFPKNVNEIYRKNVYKRKFDGYLVNVWFCTNNTKTLDK